ncbi:helix-turn-helix transcriptional regulator [Novosphingobium sp. BL-52-GroH]|uniref:helix-turn-helix domain-containing protein n=1 Tax=Novosphingobium sp. BL-52-GroH TaxID=3349877 RepID=UPI00384CDC09
MSSSPNSFLTRRQCQCLKLVGKGLKSKEIARELGISPSTVDNHVLRAMERLEVSSRTKAAHLFMNEMKSPDDRVNPVPVMAIKTIAQSLNQIVDSLLAEPEIWKSDLNT